jgi:hypothetical protein
VLECGKERGKKKKKHWAVFGLALVREDGDGK